MTSPFVIDQGNLSEAWITTLKRIVEGSGKEIIPLLVTITDFGEDLEFRKSLNAHLIKNKRATVETVSETIFPDSLYQLSKKDRFKLYELYLKNLPRVKKIDPKGNGRGTYFERMIAYDGSNNTINQLENVIISLQAKNVKRRSKLQISIFDPRIDHTNGMFQGFPCLQHVTFFVSENGGLVLNSFYAIQYLFRRGYGNWLGLINLGKFVANELNIEFERFNCYIGVEQLEITKSEAKKVLKYKPNK